MSWIPVISQVKSFVQWASGDSEGARQTQIDFLNQCPVVSQGKSFYHWVDGDNEAARETQKQCGKAMLGVIDGIPVAGHIKGGIHYIAGDREGGDNAMKAASRTVGVIAGGAGGFLVGGPVGAVAGGIAGGAAMDGITTGVDSAVHGEFRPAGAVAVVDEIVANVKNDEGHKIGGNAFDLAVMVVGDGLTGHMAGKYVGKKIEAVQAVKRANGTDLAMNVEKAFEHQNMAQMVENMDIQQHVANAELQAGEAGRWKQEFHQQRFHEAGNLAGEAQADFKRVAREAKALEAGLKKELADLAKDAREPIGPNRVHALVGDRVGEVAVDAGKKARLVYEVNGVNPEGGVNLSFKEYLPDHNYAEPGCKAAVAKEVALNNINALNIKEEESEEEEDEDDNNEKIKLE